LFTAEYARVVGIANRVLADPHEAEDVAQDVFIDFHRLHSASAQYAPAWLHRAAAHASLNRLRGARRRQKREVAQAMEEGERAGADAAHLEGCPECQAQFKVVSADARSIATLLAVPEARVDVGRSFERVMQHRKSQPALVRFPILRPSARPLTLAFVAAIAAG